MSFTPAELAAEIRRHRAGLAVSYRVDPVRQAIADSWPETIDDTAARSQWGWRPAWDRTSMTRDMLEKLGGARGSG